MWSTFFFFFFGLHLIFPSQFLLADTNNPRVNQVASGKCSLPCLLVPTMLPKISMQMIQAHDLGFFPHWYPCVLGVLHVGYTNPNHISPQPFILKSPHSPQSLLGSCPLYFCWSLSGQCWVPFSAVDTWCALFALYICHRPFTVLLLCPLTAVKSSLLPSLAFRPTLRLSKQLSSCPAPFSQAPMSFLLIKAQAIEYMKQSSITCLKAHEHLYGMVAGALNISLLSSLLKRVHVTMRRSRG